MNRARRWRVPWRALRSELPVALSLAALAFALAASGWTWRADRVVYDFGLGVWSRPPPPGIVIVAIDDASVEAIGRWPWSRAVHSTLLDRLAQAQPRAIGLDLILSEADPDPQQDRLLAQMLRRAAPVVMPVVWQAGAAGLAPRTLLPAGELAAAVSLGTAEAAVDLDGVLRHAFLEYRRSGESYAHMALTLMLAGGEQLREGFPVVSGPPHRVAGSENWYRTDRFLVRYAGPPGLVRRVSYQDVLRGTVAPETLRGQYVLVGMTAQGLGDTLATPVNRDQHAMPGVEVLANILYTLRSGDTLREAPLWPAAALAAAMVLLLVLAMERVDTRWALMLALGSVPLAFATSLLALGAGLWWSPLPYSLAAALAYPLWSWRRLERAVDLLDVEIRRLQPEGGPLSSDVREGALPASAEAARGSEARDRLAARLDVLHAATEAVRSVRSFLIAALAGMPTAMLVADENGRVMLANALTARVFDVDSALDMQGMDLPGLLVEFVTPQPMDWQTLFSAATVAPPGGFVVEAQVARLGDFLLHVDSVFVLGQRRWLVTLADVTPIKQAQRRRDETLAFVSHDLRSPASSIMLLADMHLKGHMHMPHDELLAEVHRLSTRMLQLSDDVVRVAHAESRPLNLAATGLAQLLREVQSDFRPQAVSAEVTLTVQPHDEDASWVLDRPLVLRAIGNLVSNAIKHSPRGAEVQLRSWLREGDLVLAVSDAGPGLSHEQRRKLQSEAQGLPAGDRRGVGLGLLFVQRVAARHRGQLLVRTGPDGAGTTFELQLQALPVEPRDPDPASAPDGLA